jgi:uncharacterized lipoprotein YmbA
MQTIHMTRWVLSALCAVLLSGCRSSAPVRLYLLRAPDNVPVQPVHAAHLEGAVVLVDRVGVPKHLERLAIVTRASEVELAYSDFHRWGEPLAGNLSEVLALDIDMLLPECTVMAKRAANRMNPDYLIQVQVLSMTGKLGKRATLVARWGLFSGAEDELLKTGVGHYALALESEDHDAYVAAMGRLVADLSRDIVSGLRKTVPRAVADADASP